MNLKKPTKNNVNAESQRERGKGRREEKKCQYFCAGQRIAFKLRFVCILRKLYSFEPILIARNANETERAREMKKFPCCFHRMY